MIKSTLHNFNHEAEVGMTSTIRLYRSGSRRQPFIFDDMDAGSARQSPLSS